MSLHAAPTSAHALLSVQIYIIISCPKVGFPRYNLAKECPKFADLQKYRQLGWLRHVARQKEDRLPKQLLFGIMEGSGREGRPVKSWNDCLKDLDFIGFTLPLVEKAPIQGRLERTY